MGAKFSNNTNRQHRELDHATSTQSVGIDNGPSGSRERGRTVNGNGDSRPVAVPSRFLASNRDFEIGHDVGSSPVHSRSRRRPGRRHRNESGQTHSLPAHLFSAFLSADIKCPVCNKNIQSDDIEVHLIQCLTKPRITYNEDTLTTDAGECAICFDDMNAGDKIARLPCLCIYHKKCIDEWFQRNRCCPEHPEQLPPPPQTQVSEITELPEVVSPN